MGLQHPWGRFLNYLGPLLKHGLIASHVYINIHAINGVLDAERVLTMEQAAKELWVSVIKEKSTP